VLHIMMFKYKYINNNKNKYLVLVWIPSHDFYISVQSITSNALLTMDSVKIVELYYCDSLTKCLTTVKIVLL